MKEDSCNTCGLFKGSGKPCSKSGGVPMYKYDWCGSYRFKRADINMSKFFAENMAKRRDNLIYMEVEA